MFCMNGQACRWDLLSAAIAERLDALGIDQAELVRRSGLSDATVRGFMLGRLRGDPRPSSVAKLENGLGWRRHSVDAVLSGGEPQPKTTVNPSDPDAVAQLAQAVRSLLLDAEDQRKRMSAFDARLVELSSEIQIAVGRIGSLESGQGRLPGG